MKKITSFLILCALSAFLIGCSSGEATTDASDTPTEKSKPEKADEPKTDEGATTTAAMVACAGCKQEFAADKLKDHDGAKMCEACIASHGH